MGSYGSRPVPETIKMKGRGRFPMVEIRKGTRRTDKDTERQIERGVAKSDNDDEAPTAWHTQIGRDL